MKKLYDFAQKVWHYFKCVILLRREIGFFTKKKFKGFGKNSLIEKPMKVLSGENKISLGENTTILKGARLQVYGDNEKNASNIKIGDGCYIGFNLSVLAKDTGKVNIGNDVLIASDVIITNENHGINPESELPYMSQELTARDTEIGDGCWIGEKACILPGVKIGKKCIIGAASVVTKSVPDYSMAVGSPAKVIKRYNFESHKWEGINNAEV